MKSSPAVIIAFLATAALLLLSAGLVDWPSAARARGVDAATVTNPTPGPARPPAWRIPSSPPASAGPIPALEHLWPLAIPPAPPAIPPRLISLPIPGQPLTLPVLYMHQVVPIPPDIASWAEGTRAGYLRQSVTACAFAAQMDWLMARGYHTVLPRDVVAFWDQGAALPANPIILTFDDGSPDWYTTILPILRSHGFVAEFYVTLEHIGSAISWNQLGEMASVGMGIGAHDVNHVQLTGGRIVPASPEVMRYQVGEAKHVLEANLGVVVDSMAYVGGGYDAELMSIVQGAGYTSARAINRGTWQEPGARFRLRVSRINVWDDLVGGTLDSAINCVLDPAMSTFESRVTGSNPG